MSKKWEVIITEDMLKDNSTERVLITVFTIRDKFFKDKSVYVTEDDKWSPRNDYFMPKGILPIEAVFFFMDTDIRYVSVNDNNTGRAVCIGDNTLTVEGDEELFNDCWLIWKASENAKSTKRIQTPHNGVVYQRNQKASERNYLMPFEFFMEWINKYKVNKNLKILFKSANEFVNLNDVNKYSSFIEGKEVCLIINYDAENLCYSHLDFIGNHWAFYNCNLSEELV